MAQLKFVQGGTTHTLPFPQGFAEASEPRVADYPALDGTIQRDTRSGVTTFVVFYQIQWQDLTEAEMATISAAWRDMCDFSTWTMTVPEGTVGNVAVQLDPQRPQLTTLREGAPGGEAWFQAQLNVWTA